jgi:hypothetical protein
VKNLLYHGSPAGSDGGVIIWKKGYLRYSDIIACFTAFNCNSGNPKGTYLLEDVGVDGGIILK